MPHPQYRPSIASFPRFASLESMWMNLFLTGFVAAALRRLPGLVDFVGTAFRGAPPTQMLVSVGSAVLVAVASRPPHSSYLNVPPVILQRSERSQRICPFNLLRHPSPRRAVLARSFFHSGSELQLRHYSLGSLWASALRTLIFQTIPGANIQIPFLIEISPCASTQPKISSC